MKLHIPASDQGTGKQDYAAKHYHCLWHIAGIFDFELMDRVVVLVG